MRLNSRQVRDRLLLKICLSPPGIGVSLSELNAAFRGCKPKVNASVYMPILDALVRDGLVRLVTAYLGNSPRPSTVVLPRADNPECELCGTTACGPVRVDADEFSIIGPICLECYRDLEIEARQQYVNRRRERDRKRKAAQRERREAARASRPGVDPASASASAEREARVAEIVRAEARRVAAREAARRLAERPDAERRVELEGEHRAEYEAVRKLVVAARPSAGVVPCGELRSLRSWPEGANR